MHKLNLIEGKICNLYHRGFQIQNQHINQLRGVSGKCLCVGIVKHLRAPEGLRWPPSPYPPSFSPLPRTSPPQTVLCRNPHLPYPLLPLCLCHRPTPSHWATPISGQRIPSRPIPRHLSQSPTASHWATPILMESGLGRLVPTGFLPSNVVRLVLQKDQFTPNPNWIWGLTVLNLKFNWIFQLNSNPYLTNFNSKFTLEPYI